MEVSYSLAVLRPSYTAQIHIQRRLTTILVHHPSCAKNASPMTTSAEFCHLLHKDNSRYSYSRERMCDSFNRKWSEWPWNGSVSQLAPFTQGVLRWTENAALLSAAATKRRPPSSRHTPSASPHVAELSRRLHEGQSERWLCNQSSTLFSPLRQLFLFWKGGW